MLPPANARATFLREYITELTGPYGPSPPGRGPAAIGAEAVRLPGPRVVAQGVPAVAASCLHILDPQ